VPEIVRRQEAVAELLADREMRASLIGLLRQIHDLERLSARLGYRSANARDLAALRRTLEVIPEMRKVLESRKSGRLRRAADQLEIPHELVDHIARALVDDPPLAIKEGGIIRAGYDIELDETREIATQGTHWIAKFQHQEIERTEIPSLKIGFNKIFGYYLEVTNTHKDKIPEHYIRKQTLKNCERFVTAELKEYEAKVLGAREKAVELEHQIFSRLRDEATTHIPTLQQIARGIAETDVLATFARLADEKGYVRPEVNESGRLRIEDGRHPVVEAFQRTETFVPNSVDLDTDQSIMVITGPNMAGKSTYIRQVALLTLLAQTGSFIPAREAEIGVVDRIFTRVGAADDLTRGQSTFMVEMIETANILNNATPRSLLILDEVGRGTSTFDGVSLAWAITEFIAEKISCRTLFATHYHELTSLTSVLSSIRNFNFSVKEWNDEIIFLRTIVEGGTDKSYGIHVARLAGIPGPVLERAREILSNLECQAFDIQDKPKLAHKRGGGANRGDAPRSTSLQLDFFRNQNEEILEELKRIEIDRMTPLEALEFLAEIREKLV
jgi:DNA mismatch repair protein MutS